MSTIPFHIQAWAGWTQEALATEDHTPSLLRRRITPMGRRAMSAAWNLPDIENTRFVFSSRHGEFERTVSLMEQTIKKTDLSPADFTLSVHHALIGLLSIAKHNKKGHTAIASGADSFCFGLMEAAACLAEKPDVPVLFIHCDALLPEPYDIFQDGQESPVVVAMTLNSRATGDGAYLTQEFEIRSSEQQANHARAFLDFIASDADACTSDGTERSWHWKRHAVA